MRRLYVEVEKMCLDHKVSVEFWDKFIHKYDELKNALEKLEDTVRVNNNDKAVKVFVPYETMDSILGDCLDYYFELIVHPVDCGVWAEYDDCCTLFVGVCNVGG